MPLAIKKHRVYEGARIERKSPPPYVPSLNDDWRPRFLRTLQSHGTILDALEKAKVRRIDFDEAVSNDPEFSADVERAQEDFSDILEREAIRRAVHGWDEPVFHGGEICGVKRKFSDKLLEVLLTNSTARKKEKYSPKIPAGGLTGSNAPVINFVIRPPEQTALPEGTEDVEYEVEDVDYEVEDLEEAEDLGEEVPEEW